MADWDNECYFTYDKEYEAKQLDLFYDLYEKVQKIYVTSNYSNLTYLPELIGSDKRRLYARPLVTLIKNSIS